MTLVSLPPIIGDEIPIIAYIQNAHPEILDVDILNDVQDQTTSLDPGSKFQIDVLVRDNNTLADIVEIEVILYSSGATPGDADREEDHYTFRWTSAGFVNPSGVGSLFISECVSPTNLELGEGTWRFTLGLSKKALKSSQWSILVWVEDEAERAEYSSYFEVTGFVSLSMDVSQITFSGSPGETTGADQNPMAINLLSNHLINIGCSGVEFVGVQNSDMIIPITSFSIDDDQFYSESMETGLPELTLSDFRQALFTSIGFGMQSLSIHVFVAIPEPFVDQDYSGSIIFELYNEA